MTRWQPYTEWMEKVRFSRILETLIWPLLPSELPVRASGSVAPRRSVWRRKGRRPRRAR